MAKYCIEIFGDLLVKEPLPDFPVSILLQFFTERVSVSEVRLPRHSSARAWTTPAITKQTEEQDTHQEQTPSP